MASHQALEADAQAPPGTGYCYEQRLTDERTPLLKQNDTGDSCNVWFVGGIQRYRIIIVNTGVLLLVGTILILVFFAGYLVHGTELDGFCMTPECIHVASQFLHNLSPIYQTINPCTNFDAYVCDGWRERQLIPVGQGMASSIDDVRANVRNVARAILEGSYPGMLENSDSSLERIGPMDQQNFDMIKRAYNACMALPEIRKIGVAPLEASLRDLAKTFDDATSVASSPTWTKTYLWLHQNDNSPLVSARIGADEKSPDLQVIYIEPAMPPGLPSKRYYENETIVSEYQDAMAQVLAALKLTDKNATKFAAAIIQFETEVAMISPEVEDIEGDPVKLYNPMSLADATRLVPQIGLDYVLTSLAPSNYIIDRVIVTFPLYLENLSTIINRTPKDTLQKYFLWRLIVDRFGIVEGPEVIPYIRFLRKIGARELDTSTERSQTCIDHTSRILSWVLSRFFVQATSWSKSDELANTIVSDLKEAFIEGFQKLDWMDNPVKILASQKLRNVLQKIGYPTASPNITDPKTLRDFYSDLNISDTYYDNYVSSVNSKVQKAWSKLGKPTDRDEWPGSALSVDAGYDFLRNQIIFPAGIIQFPYFGRDLPGYANYGSFGAIAGHELSHAFHPHGRMYDVNGNLSDWWTNHTSQEFNKRAECFISEYSNFTVEGYNGKVLHLNGRQTVNDDVADAGGVSAAWSAWQKRRQTNPDKHLPGMASFTQQQLFYISYGNIWCVKYKPEALIREVLTNPHSPGMFRTLGPVMMNSRAFRQAFNCPEREPVCEIW